MTATAAMTAPERKGGTAADKRSAESSSARENT